MSCYKVNIRTMNSLYCHDNECMKNSVKFKSASKSVLQPEEPAHCHLEKKNNFIKI